MPAPLPLLLGLLLAAPATAPGAAMLDSGRFVIYDHGREAGTEAFAYQLSGDSLVVSATSERRLRGADGSLRPLVKRMELVANALDYGLRRYVSNLDFDGHHDVKGIAPGDTLMSVYSERDSVGVGDRLVRPPGRLFVMDPLMFTLFDVICRNLAGESFERRPVELITLGPKSSIEEATATRGGLDTLHWGGAVVHARRYDLADSSSRFVAWVDAHGRMLRLEFAAAGLQVERQPLARGGRPVRRPRRR